MRNIFWNLYAILSKYFRYIKEIAQVDIVQVYGIYY